MIIEFITSGLAGKIIDVWVVYSESKQKKLDREHQLQLQNAQHQHELMLEKYRAKNVKKNPVPNIEGSLLERLTYEAQLLSEMDFEVVYESVGDGYGLSLPIEGNRILVIWIPTRYPEVSPDIYEANGVEVNKIDFAPNTWRSYHTIKDVVLALTVGD